MISNFLILPPYMYGWIIGCENDISYQTQTEVERALSIDEAHIHEIYII